MKHLKIFENFENDEFINNSYIVVVKKYYDQEKVANELESIGCEIVRNYPFSVIIVKYDGNKSDLYVDGVESAKDRKSTRLNSSH